MCSVQGPPAKNPHPQEMAPDQPFPFYLDHNATTPLSDEAWEAMSSVRHAWGNPSSLHPYGLESKFFLDKARESVRASLGAKAAECVIFTGSGTEADNLALMGGYNRMQRVAGGAGEAKRNVILSTIYEHPAVEEVLLQFEKEFDGAVKVVRCGVDRKTGVVDVEDFKKKVRENVANLAVVSIMHANNELGSINPISELVDIVRQEEEEYAKSKNLTLFPCKPVDKNEDTSSKNNRFIQCIFHTDSSQTIGKIDANISRLKVDMMTVCGHKFYGPKGIGALVVRDPAECNPDPVLRGAKHERGIRPSTENVLFATAMAAALASAVKNLDENVAHARACRDQLYAELKKRLVDRGNFELHENGSVAHALPNTLNIAIFHKPSNLYVSAARMIIQQGRRIAMSSGSACHAVVEGEDIPVSLPLQAVGCDLNRAIGTLRLSTGKLNQMKDMTRVAEILTAACKAQMPDV